MWTCLFQEDQCTEDDPHIGCDRAAGGGLDNLDITTCLNRTSKAVDYFWATGEAEVFDKQKDAARHARADRLTKMERVKMD